MLGDREVLSVIDTRRRTGSRPGARTDGHKVALVVEGGGMRGVYIGGMLKALAEAGARPAFDEVYAVSAGAFSSCGFVLGDVEHAVEVYADYLVRDFIDWRRAVSRRGPLVSIDFLVDVVMGKQLPFDWAALTTTDIPLRPVATDRATGCAEPLVGMTSSGDWQLAMRASAAIPVVAGPPVKFAGREWVDGFVGDPLPLSLAIDGGATHILALIARAPGERRRSTRKSNARYDASFRLLTDPSDPRRHGAKLFGIRPGQGHGVGALTTDSRRLWRAGAAGETAVKEALALASSPCTSAVSGDSAQSLPLV